LGLGKATPPPIETRDKSSKGGCICNARCKEPSKEKKKDSYLLYQIHSSQFFEVRRVVNQFGHSDERCHGLTEVENEQPGDEDKSKVVDLVGQV